MIEDGGLTPPGKALCEDGCHSEVSKSMTGEDKLTPGTSCQSAVRLILSLDFSKCVLHSRAAVCDIE